MSSVIYNAAKKKLCDGTIAFITDTIKCMLVSSAYTPNADDEFVDAITASPSAELSGTGYVAGFGGAGRKSLTANAINVDNVNDRAEFDAADLTWSAIDAGTIKYLVLIKEVTNDAASHLIAAIDIGSQATNGGDITVTWNAEGILQLT